MHSLAEDIDEFVNVRPFLRWAGSKRKLIPHLVPFIPIQFNKYYEPFLGGGSMFFFLGPEAAEISDASPSLVETYRAVKRDVEGVLNYLKPLRPSRTAFERIKKQKTRNLRDAAGAFIFLNKACWNGLYRVNSDGIFNVPYGWPRSNFLINEENFRKCAKQLRRRSVSIRCQDFEDILERVGEQDFVFFDPPYVTAHNMNGFVDWNERLFSWKDQIRLANAAKELVKRGANVLITNADHDDVRELYKSFRYKKVVRTSTLAGDTSRRTQTSEAIFMSGPAYRDTENLIRRRKAVSYGSDRDSRAR